MTHQEAGRIGGLTAARNRRAKGQWVRHSGRYWRVLGTRVCACGCGGTFVYTTGTQRRRFLTAKCACTAEKARLGRQRASELHRRRLFGAIADRLAATGRITRMDLMAALMEAYQRGRKNRLNAAWRARKEAAA